MMMIVALILAAVLSTPFVGAVQLPAPPFAMNVQQKSQPHFRLVQQDLFSQAVGMTNSSSGVMWGKGWINVDPNDPLGYYQIACDDIVGCSFSGLKDTEIMAANLPAGNFSSVSGCTDTRIFEFDPARQRIWYRKIPPCMAEIYSSGNEIIGVNNSVAYINIVSDVTETLSESDQELASKNHAVFQDQRCSGQQNQLKTLYNAMVPAPGRYMANQNAASAYGEIFYIYSEVGALRQNRNAFVVSRYENVSIDTRYRPYERCNSFSVFDLSPFKCERSSYWSQLGVGALWVSENGTIVRSCPDASTTDIEWYSLNEQGNGRTYNFDESVNTTITLNCLLTKLEMVLPWGSDLPFKLYRARERHGFGL
jgi:hypothetical protein